MPRIAAAIGPLADRQAARLDGSSTRPADGSRTGGGSPCRARSSSFGSSEWQRTTAQRLGLQTTSARASRINHNDTRPLFFFRAKPLPQLCASVGELHEPFWNRELCPFCGDFITTCDCIFAVLALTAEEREVVEKFEDDSVQPLRGICDRWRAAVQTKARVPVWRRSVIRRPEASTGSKTCCVPVSIL